MKVSISDLKIIYDEEIKKNVKNKRKILEFERNKIEYLVDIKKVLESGEYNGGRYNIFLVYKPKVRVVMSQSVYDKVINHYVARFILMPRLEKYLNDRNCATRKNMGTSYAIELFKRDIESFKKYDKFYFLKLDISKFFYRIDHQILIDLIKEDLEEDELKLVKTIVNSTNHGYVKKLIEMYENKLNIELPRYEHDKGLPIGNMTSQFLAIFYLSKLQHFIRHNLKLKFVNYMDDYIIIHEDKEYLKRCLEIIKDKLLNEYKLEVNKNKTNITRGDVGVNFLGYTFKARNNKTIIKLSQSTKRNIKKGIKRSRYLYENNKITFQQLFSSIETCKYSYKYVNPIIINNVFEKYWY